jgi:hypothetical protein
MVTTGTSVEYVFRTLRRDLMRWFGIGLALVGVVGALVAWFAFKNVPFLIGGVVFMIIGLIVFINGTRTEPK